MHLSIIGYLLLYPTLSATEPQMSAMKITATAFQKIYDPSPAPYEPWYINDHCFIQDEQNNWHLFGITHAEPRNPLNEKFFAHATSSNLHASQWNKQPDVLHADYENWKETHVWAPHIIKHDNLYWMFYCGGGDDNTQYRIHLATSPDLKTWTRHAANPLLQDGFDARDPMVLRVEGRWIMYYTGNRPAAKGNHVVLAVESSDLVHWSEPKVVLTNPEIGTYGGPTESPFVFKRKGKYYLSVCLNDPYNDTGIYESEDPLHWDFEKQVGYIPSHAAEIIELPDDRWVISRCGWGQGGVYLADLIFND